MGANKKISPELPPVQNGVPHAGRPGGGGGERDPEKNRQFVERLGAKLDAETNLFHDVFYKGDLKMLGSKALLFVPESDLARTEEDA